MKLVKTLFGFLLISLMFGHAYAAKTVLFHGDGTSFVGKKIYDLDYTKNYSFDYVDGGKLLGFVGDHLSLETGIHYLRITGKRNHDMLVTVAVGIDDRAVIVDVEYKPRLCTTRHLVDFGFSMAFKERNGVGTFRLREPEFGDALGPSTCIRFRRRSCTNYHILLTVSSEPPGADVWIGGKRRGSTTAKLSLPFCENGDTEAVLVRIPGFVNCEQDVSLYAGVNKNILCTLTKP
jgi:hypothetical protein